MAGHIIIISHLLKQLDIHNFSRAKSLPRHINLRNRNPMFYDKIMGYLSQVQRSMTKGL